MATQVPLSLLRDELAQRLDQERISQRFLAGAVNICTLMPMRSIPFKVVLPAGNERRRLSTPACAIGLLT
ncbi:exodeoxyribonuclease V subunit gamma [Escherichia coli]|nr:exodeoxyribonuclease V subunit gamma [Escherichia coli]